jgi:hypothetical protein
MLKYAIIKAAALLALFSYRVNKSNPSSASKRSISTHGHIASADYSSVIFSGLFVFFKKKQIIFLINLFSLLS